jgi:anti-anti-sigma factor
MLDLAHMSERFGDTVILTLSERMDIFSAPVLMKRIDVLLGEGARTFIVDASNVRILDADGDYPLLHLLKRTQEVGGSMTLVCPAENPIRVFYEMMHLDTLFDIVDTLDAALEQFELFIER